MPSFFPIVPVEPSKAKQVTATIKQRRKHPWIASAAKRIERKRKSGRRVTLSKRSARAIATIATNINTSEGMDYDP